MDSKSAMFMSNNCKDIKHNTHISRLVIFLRDDDKCKLQNIEWCEGDLQLEDITNTNVGENYLNSRMKYIMVSIDN